MNLRKDTPTVDNYLVPAPYLDRFSSFLTSRLDSTADQESTSPEMARIRPRLAMAILGFTLPFLLNCALIGTTAIMMVHDENPLLLVVSITLSLCVTLVVIKSVFHLLTELAGPLETGPARRITAKDAKSREETIPLATSAPCRAPSIFSRPSSPVPPPSPAPRSPPSPAPSMRSHVVRLSGRCDYATNV